MGNCASGLCVVCTKDFAERMNKLKTNSIIARGRFIDWKVQISLHLPFPEYEKIVQGSSSQRTSKDGFQAVLISLRSRRF